MFDPLEILVLSLGYLLLLFAIAYLGDRFPQTLVLRSKPLLIALAGTYTTTWMFFGTPAQAVNNGWYIPPTFLGSMLVLLVFPAFLQRLIKVAKTTSSTSIADFIASHYGKSHLLAMLVTVVAIVAVLPYIALQLKAVAMSFQLITGENQHNTLATPVWKDTALYIALLMAMFSIMFGTRHIDSKEHHHGLMLAVAFEAIVKLLCFCAIGYFTCFVLFDGIEDLFIEIARHPALDALILSHKGDSGFVAATILGMTALFCLPRQFHILMVESTGPQDINTLRWLIPLYMLIISFFILPIGYGGFLLLFGQGINPESFSLQLPMRHQHSMLTLLSYLGGLSAGSSMVIVASVALATMICNHLIMPLLLRQHLLDVYSRDDMTGVLRLIRRAAIIILMLLAYSYYRYLTGYSDLGSIGLLALVLVAQFAPAIVGALYWNEGHKYGVLSGVGGGFLVWLYTLITPSLVDAGWLGQSLLDNGPLGLHWLRPEHLFNFSWSPLSNSVCWSLTTNLCFYIAVSKWSTKRFAQKNHSARSGLISVKDLQEVAARFLGEQQARLALKSFDQNLTADELASEACLDYVENLLAGVIGASSANQVLLFVGQDKLQLESPATLIEETSQVFQYGRELLQTSIDNISQGISVVNQHQQLVFWNRRYLELFNYPNDMIHVGRNVADLVRFNAQQGECGPGSVEQHVRKRIAHMRRGNHYVFQRNRRDGSVLEIRGNPMPDGGYVTTYTDITEVSRAMRELENAKNHLEERVQQRTAELTRAKAHAEEANIDKTRFLAAAGHDLVQPLNALRLFISALQQRPLDGQSQQLVEQLANSAQAAESLINALLDIAKLDAGAVSPSFSHFPINQVLQPLTSDFAALAQARGLDFRYHGANLNVYSDSHLLRRVLQNLLSNALYYTRTGRVLFGCRRHNQALSIEVWDTGIGIDACHHQAIFTEFNRLAQDNDGSHERLGLGLATVKRLCELLHHPLNMQSTLGKGSVFRIQVPISRYQAPPLRATPLLSLPSQLPQQLQDSHILCIDNDTTVLTGLQALLQCWGCKVTAVKSLAMVDEHLNSTLPDIILADFHLNSPHNGIDCVLTLFDQWQQTRPCIVISADRTETVRVRAQQQGFLFLQKPVKAAAMRATLNQASLQRKAQENGVE